MSGAGAIWVLVLAKCVMINGRWLIGRQCGWWLELETKVREDFTITEKAPTMTLC